MAADPSEPNAFTNAQPMGAPPAPPSRGKGWIGWLLLGVVLLGLAYWLLRPKPEAVAASDASAAPVVMQLLPSEIYEVAPVDLRDSVQVTGSLKPLRSLSIPAEVSGRVDMVNYQVGNQVTAGAELVTIDMATLRNRLDQQKATAEATRAQLELARTQLDRATDLLRRGVSTTTALESEGAKVAQLEASYSALLRQVDLAEDDLAKALITAPFAGVISARSVDPGTYVTIGTALMELVDITSLELEGGVPVNYAPQLKPGQVVELTVDGLAEHRFEGVIERIAPVAVSGTRVLPVYARIENKDGLLSGGMFASGLLVLEQSLQGIGIPAGALREDEGGSYVLQIVEGKVLRKAITVARSWDRGRTLEVSEGLSGGEQIVALELERLQPDMAVTVVGK